MRYAMRLTLVAGIAAVLGCGSVTAADLGEVNIGDAMPDFTLTDTTGKEHTLSEIDDKIVVLNFCSQQCPFSRGADPAINELATEFADKDVVFIGVDSHKSTTPEEITGHIEKLEVPYPIVKDVDNAYADKVGAKVTPEIFVVAKDGTLAYHGAPDDRSGPDDTPENHYLRDALAALTSGQDIETTETSAWGCGIKRK